MISLAGGEEEERTCVGRSTGRPSIVPASDDHCHCLPGWRLDDQRRPREEENDDFVGPGGGADEATAAPRPGTDGTASNHTVDEADEGAKEKTEERRSGVVREDEERRLAVARAGGVRATSDERRESAGEGGGRSDNVGGDVVARGGGGRRRETSRRRTMLHTEGSGRQRQATRAGVGRRVGGEALK